MTDSAKKTILVVDDEVTVCKSIRKALTCDTYDIDIAVSGEEALRMEEKKTYDVMIVDLMMPGLSGLDLLKSLKARRPGAQVIMVTGYPTMKNTLQAMQIGAFDFLPKPFLPADIRSVVARALAALGEGEEGGGSGSTG
jgi:two-component system phosphate regulon sensor histidine kinase PhoR